MKYIRRIFLGIFIVVILITASVFVLIRFYKKEMAELLITNLKENYGLELKVGDADVSFFSNWPQASVELKNIYLASTMYADKNEPLLQAGSISLSFNLALLLKKKFTVNSVSIKDAEITLIKNGDGSKNFEFKHAADTVKKASAPSTIQFEISRVSIKNTRFKFINREKNQKINIGFKNNTLHLKQAQDGMRVHMKGELMVGRLLFNEKNGSFLERASIETDLDASVYYKSKMIVVHPSSCLKINKHLYNVSSFIELGENQKLMLRVESKDVSYNNAANLLTPKIQKTMANFTVDKPFDVNALIIAKLGIKEEPIFIINIDVKDNAVKIGNSKIPYNNLSLKGSIISLDSAHQKGDIEKAKIVFSSVKGNIYDYPFTAQINIINLKDPKINIDARMRIDAQKIKFKVAQDFVLKGSCVARVNYNGPTHKLNKDEFLGTAMHLNANLFFSNFSYKEKTSAYIYMVNGKANVNNKDLKFENLHLKTDAGEFLLTGRAENFVSYVLGYSNRVKAFVNAKTEDLNLNPFLSSKEKSESPNKKTTADYKQNVQQADESDFEFNASLFAKKLYVRKVEAENANIDLSYKNRLLTIKSVKANTCEGKIAVKGTIYNLSNINAEVSMQDIDIKMLFDEFENFGQTKIESKNLKGSISVNAVFKTGLDDKMNIITESMAGEVKLKLKNGHLVNFEPVQNMSNFIFKNRDFNDVSFTELDENFKIKGYEMDIEELEIGSNILNMFVSGIYNFKQSSNINILIPWSNLRKRGKNYIPQNSGQTSENSKGLKLNYSGPTNNMKLSLGHKDIAQN